MGQFSTMPVGKNKEVFLQVKPVAKSSEHTSKSLNSNSLNMRISIRKRPVLPLQSLYLARCALNEFRPLRDDWFDSIATNAPAQNYTLYCWDLVSVFSLTSPWPWRYFESEATLRETWGRDAGTQRSSRGTGGKQKVKGRQRGDVRAREREGEGELSALKGADCG